jgi:hypothetical protein
MVRLWLLVHVLALSVEAVDKGDPTPFRSPFAADYHSQPGDPPMREARPLLGHEEDDEPVRPFHRRALYHSSTQRAAQWTVGGGSYDSELRSTTCYDEAGGTDYSCWSQDSGPFFYTTQSFPVGTTIRVTMEDSACDGWNGAYFTGWDQWFTMSPSCDPEVVTFTVGTFETHSLEDDPVWSTGVTHKAWELKSGSTPSYYTGPEAAADGSYYAFIETSSPAVNGDIYDLNYDATRGCGGLGTGHAVTVAFMYHMYGSTIGTLEVRTGDTVVWSRAGPQHTADTDAWTEAHVPLGYVQNFSFVAHRGTSYTGDIAIDAVEVKCSYDAAVTSVTDLEQKLGDSLNYNYITLAEGTYALTEPIGGTSGWGRDLALQGAGKGLTILEGSSTYRHLYATSGSAIMLKDLSLINGVSMTPDALNGGSVYLDDASLTMQSCAMENNVADDGSGGYPEGGALFVKGGSAFLAALSCDIINNCLDKASANSGPPRRRLRR